MIREINQVAAMLKKDPPASRVRQGSVVSVAGRTCTVTIGGGTVQVPGVRAADHVTATAGASCWLVTDGRDWLIIATTNL